MNQFYDVNFVTQTNGRGYWTSKKKTIKINKVFIHTFDGADQDFGELRAYFDAKEWDVDNDGLVYSDPGWLASFKSCMATLGFSNMALNDIGYTEQGMQGETYVSLDVGGRFLQELTPLYRFAVNKQSVNA